MSSGITKKCFPPANKCVNCERKGHDDRPARVGDTSKEYARCSGCRLMTYCDRDCQREHWLRIHKHHCRFLEGRKQANCSEHNPRTCSLCVESRKSSPNEITSINSPNMHCYIQQAITWMKEGIASFFKFHSEGKTCSCSLTSPWPGHLPFSFGELSGHYVGGGPHEMMSHALKLSVAIEKKAENKNVKEEIKNFLLELICGRVTIWVDLLITGKSTLRYFNNEAPTLAMNSLKRYLGPSHPWWIALRFSLDVLRNMEIQSSLPVTIKSDFMEKCKDDPRFKTLKELLKHDESQYKNIVFASNNNLLSQFKVWPKLVENSLIVLLPSGLHCQTCKDPVDGQFALMGLGHEYPLWLPTIGENGSCEAYCSLRKNPNCVIEVKNDVRDTIETNQDQWKAYLDEKNLFFKLSRICDECGRRSLSSHRCAACLGAQYCSTQCQMEDLDFHKSVCAKWAEDQSKTLGSSKEQKKHWKSVIDKMQKQ